MIFGSDHKGDRGSIKDLLLSWIPGAGASKKQNQPNLKRELLSLAIEYIFAYLRKHISHCGAVHCAMASFSYY